MNSSVHFVLKRSAAHKQLQGRGSKIDLSNAFQQLAVRPFAAEQSGRSRCPAAATTSHKRGHLGALGVRGQEP
jgi:hypothetical protein